MPASGAVSSPPSSIREGAGKEQGRSREGASGKRHEVVVQAGEPMSYSYLHYNMVC
jgi:hypothetical protein